MCGNNVEVEEFGLQRERSASSRGEEERNTRTRSDRHGAPRRGGAIGWLASGDSPGQCKIRRKELRCSWTRRPYALPSAARPRGDQRLLAATPAMCRRGAHSAPHPLIGRGPLCGKCRRSTHPVGAPQNGIVVNMRVEKHTLLAGKVAVAFALRRLVPSGVVRCGCVVCVFFCVRVGWALSATRNSPPTRPGEM